MVKAVLDIWGILHNLLPSPMFWQFHAGVYGLLHPRREWLGQRVNRWHHNNKTGKEPHASHQVVRGSRTFGAFFGFLRYLGVSRFGYEYRLISLGGWNKCKISVSPPLFSLPPTFWQFHMSHIVYYMHGECLWQGSWDGITTRLQRHMCKSSSGQEVLGQLGAISTTSCPGPNILILHGLLYSAAVTMFPLWFNL